MTSSSCPRAIPSFVAPTSGTSYSSVCNANPVHSSLLWQAFGVRRANRVYTIWAYSGAARPAAMAICRYNRRRSRKWSSRAAAQLTSRRPYFNLDAGCSIAVSAHIKYQYRRQPHPRPSPLCAQA